MECRCHSLRLGMQLVGVSLYIDSCGCRAACCFCRLLAAYRSRVAAEGEYEEQELPGELVDELEGAAGPAARAFAVSMQTCGAGAGAAAAAAAVVPDTHSVGVGTPHTCRVLPVHGTTASSSVGTQTCAGLQHRHATATVSVCNVLCSVRLAQSWLGSL